MSKTNNKDEHGQNARTTDQKARHSEIRLANLWAVLALIGGVFLTLAAIEGLQ